MTYTPVTRSVLRRTMRTSKTRPLLARRRPAASAVMTGMRAWSITADIVGGRAGTGPRHRVGRRAREERRDDGGSECRVPVGRPRRIDIDDDTFDVVPRIKSPAVDDVRRATRDERYASLGGLVPDATRLGSLPRYPRHHVERGLTSPHDRAPPRAADAGRSSCPGTLCCFDTFDGRVVWWLATPGARLWEGGGPPHEQFRDRQSSVTEGLADENEMREIAEAASDGPPRCWYAVRTRDRMPRVALQR